MYKLDSFSDDNGTQSFNKLLKSKWDEAHENFDIFRYKINKLEERLVGKYLLLLNPDRQLKRRAPENVVDICQRFDSNKFNFTKASPNEILFSIEQEGDIHTVLVNVSPISKYHSLLCPSVNKCLPQVVTVDSLRLAVRIMFLAHDRDLRIGFNSLCAFASVNHLHYHLFYESNDLAVENLKWQHLKGNLYQIDDTYPVPAFCFDIQKHFIFESCAEIYKVFEYLLNKCIGHNILLHARKRDVVSVLVWPRKNTEGAKQLATFNVAILELAGWFPIYDAEAFKTLKTDDLEKELLKWRRDDFENLCTEIKNLF